MPADTYSKAKNWDSSGSDAAHGDNTNRIRNSVTDTENTVPRFVLLLISLWQLEDENNVNYELYLKMRNKSKNIGGWFLLRSVGDKTVDILFVVGDDRERLSDEFVRNSDHGKLSGLSVLSEPRVSLFTLGIEPADSPCSDIEESSGICVSVPVDVSSDVYGSSGLFVSRTDTEIPGHLLGILEVSEPAGSDDKRRSERYAYTSDGCQQRELPAELDFDKIRELRLKPVAFLFKELDRFVYGMGRSFVRDRQTCEGATKVRHGGNLLGKLTYAEASR